MRGLNRRFLGNPWTTDVLSFRYDVRKSTPRGQRLRHAQAQKIVGEILIAPEIAMAYAKRHGLPYREELSRYVVHGLLHWLGETDYTKRARERMRRREDKLLVHCGVLSRKAGTAPR